MHNHARSVKHKLIVSRMQRKWDDKFANQYANQAHKIKFACDIRYLVWFWRGDVVEPSTPEPG
jgi:hypothetical protein